jgi:hypothetical protein
MLPLFNTVKEHEKIAQSQPAADLAFPLHDLRH